MFAVSVYQNNINLAKKKLSTVTIYLSVLTEIWGNLGNKLSNIQIGATYIQIGAIYRLSKIEPGQCITKVKDEHNRQ
jgi:hypothetical protein